MGNYVGLRQVNDSDAQMWVLNSFFCTPYLIHMGEQELQTSGPKAIKNSSLCVD